VRLVLWHGYLLEGTGSNIYTQHVARAWGRLGHDVVLVCQEPRPERFALGPNVEVVSPTSARSCRSSCSTATRASRPATSQT
jgi:hypothetical protein